MIELQQKKAASQGPQYPRVTRHVRLPDKVAVRFLAEILGQDLDAMVGVLLAMGIIVGGDRAVSFDHAQLVLRKYGIWAVRAAKDD